MNHRICTRCVGYFDANDMVHTWSGHSWELTCVACNHAAMGDRELLDRIAANHQHGHWTQRIVWEMATDSARAYAHVIGAANAPAAAGRLNVLVELLARIERRTTPEIMLDVMHRAGMRISHDDDEVVSRSPSLAGNQNGAGDAQVNSVSPVHSTAPWPVRDGAE